jgi:hypothetical protein
MGGPTDKVSVQNIALIEFTEITQFVAKLTVAYCSYSFYGISYLTGHAVTVFTDMNVTDFVKVRKRNFKESQTCRIYIGSSWDPSVLRCFLLWFCMFKV